MLIIEVNLEVKMRKKIMILCFWFVLLFSGRSYSLATSEEFVPTINVVTTQGIKVELSKQVSYLENNQPIKKNVIWNPVSDEIFKHIGEHKVSGTTTDGLNVTGIIHVYSKENPVRIAAVGDSITYGMNVENVGINAYPRQLNYRLGRNFEVENFGNSGKTLLTKGDDPYVKTNEYRQSLVFNPNVIVIQLGTNDTKPWNFAKIENYVLDYLKLIDTYKSLETKPVIYISLPPKITSTAYGIQQSNLVKIIPKIFDIAEKSHADISIIDNFNETSAAKAIIPDGVHPNAQGAALIANNVYHSLRGDIQVIKDDSDINQYDKTYGAINALIDDKLYLSDLGSGEWFSYKNVDLTEDTGTIQLYAAIPYDNTKVIIRTDHNDGPIIGEKTLDRTENSSSYVYYNIPIKSYRKKAHLYISFDRPNTVRNYELARVKGVTFNYDATKPIEVDSFEELQTAINSGLNNIKVVADINFTNNLLLKRDTNIDFNGYQLNTANYYLGKDERAGHRINVVLKNGNMTGENNNGSVYVGDSYNQNYGINLTIDSVHYKGNMFVRQYVKGATVIFEGSSKVETTTGSNVYAYNVTFGENANYYGSTEGSVGSNQSGSTTISLGTGPDEKKFLVKKGATVQLYPGAKGNSYAQNGISGFTQIDVEKGGTLKGNSDQPMLRTEYIKDNAKVNIHPGANFDIVTRKAMEGFSYSYGIDYVFNQPAYLNIQSLSPTRQSFMYAYRNSSITYMGDNLFGWNSIDISTQPNKIFTDVNSFTIQNIFSGNRMGIIQTDNQFLQKNFGTLNDYFRLSSQL
ncbi:carbohydrate-binding protein [Enterococcus faecalis]|nr:carbohydrate-binding protein [Enterococcus faecalis]